MGGSLAEEYFAAQRRRAPAFAAVESCVVVAEPGALGWAAADAGRAAGRLWVHDASAQLDRILDRYRPLILSAAEDVGSSVTGRLDARPDFRSVGEPVTAMLLPPYSDLVIPPLPPGLLVRPVRRAAGDDPGGVPLEDAAAACLAADPGLALAFDVAGFTEHLRRAPDADLLAAVDDEGRVCGTAAAALVGQDATIYLVGTDPGWRGRGVASALTARVTRRAFERGARLVGLEASGQGRRLYERLGFRPAVVLRSWIRAT